MYDITVIGAAIIDVLAAPADESVFRSGSQPMENIRLSFGGDARNEAVVLSRMGKKVQLVGKVGSDRAGRLVLDDLKENGVGTKCVRIQEGLETGINIVLVDSAGERHFLTNPAGSLRTLAAGDIRPHLNDMARIVSFASLFVSPLLSIGDLTDLFGAIRRSGRTLVCDMTKAKGGERLEDLRDLLPYVDVILPNAEEIALLTGEKDPKENARLLLDAGVGTAVVKTGERGCVVGKRVQGSGAYRICRIPAVPGIRCVDSTGAGDAFAAGYLAGLTEGLDAVRCARLGCAAASCAVEQIGAAEGIRSAVQVRERYERYGSL